MHIHKEAAMGNRKLYDTRTFEVKEVRKGTGLWRDVWHLVGKFAPNSVKTKNPRNYRIRVAPDPRWDGVTQVSFHDERIYESESIADMSRRHVYGSDIWYISPYFEGSRLKAERTKFSFEDFEVVNSAAAA